MAVLLHTEASGKRLFRRSVLCLNPSLVDFNKYSIIESLFFDGTLYYFSRNLVIVPSVVVIIINFIQNQISELKYDQ